ncbi:MAG: Hsp20/alpha crystallin family protein [Pseudomonadota bacterium]
MLDSLKVAGKNISQELGRTWENLRSGWNELLTRSNDALIHFTHKKDEDLSETSSFISAFPSWSLLAGEIEETDKDILVRIEVPGMEKEDFHLTVDGNFLYLSGEKHVKRESIESTFHIMERAYGAFQRTIPLPRNVDADKAEASYKSGVLMIRLPKATGGSIRTISLS